jgi:hypothetical protein
VAALVDRLLQHLEAGMIVATERPASRPRTPCFNGL